MGAGWRVVKLRVPSKVVKVPLNPAYENSALVVQGVHRVFEGATEQGLASIHQIKANTGRVFGIEQILHEPHIVLAIARSKRNDIKVDAASDFSQALCCGSEGKAVSEGRHIIGVITKSDPVECTLMVHVDVGL